MDQAEKLKSYRRVLQQIVEQHAQMPAEPEGVESFAICDATRDHYLLMDVGWDASGRAHYVVCHLRLKDGKVWIEQDGIEYGIARDLLEAGIPKEDIVVAFYGPTPCPLTELVAA